MPELNEQYYIQKWKEVFGKNPKAHSLIKFEKSSGIAITDLKKVFGARAYEKLVIACGGTANTFDKHGYAREHFLQEWGKNFRNDVINKKIKIEDFNSSHWKFRKYNPIVSSYTDEFGSWKNIRQSFIDFATHKPEWTDVIEALVITSPENSNSTFEPVAISNNGETFYDFVPPIIQHIETTENSAIFENQVGTCFQLLGFKTKHLGQGQGQNPDGIASRPKDGYAIIYDAKSHQDGYSISASDRRAAEQYIEDHRVNLEKAGNKTLFFIFIARSFNSDSKKAIQGIREKTNVTAVLITAASLLHLVAAQIQYPYDFDHVKLKTLFSKGGQIDRETIQPFLKEIHQQGSS
ncbi:MAG TPA: restriction endonuclease FokI C-terminal domain-containing protein [bacterium]|jgi:hypothetical protein|nr:restriction endonuclease FokI C-terminal domain-containing protein [bacterium]